ncbi:MAG TPA: sugar phosphate isomerase/epimerase [Vicinamibacterales bacterium]
MLLLSTMYAQDERFAEGHRFAEFAREAGFDGLEISHSTPEPLLREIAAAAVLPVVSLHAPAPFRELEDGRPNGSLNLASLDESERKAAVAEALRTVAWAEELGTRRIVVHLGHVDVPAGQRLHPDEQALRRLHRTGELHTDEAAAVRDRLLAWRSEVAPPYLEAARRSLEALVEAAGPAGIAVGIETRLHIHEIPLPEEAAVLLAGLPERLTGYWHDVGHVEVLARLRLVPRRRWRQVPGLRPVGTHLHDVRGLRDHRAPGNGTVEWERLRELCRQVPDITLEIDQREPEELVRRAPVFLAEQGLVVRCE